MSSRAYSAGTFKFCKHPALYSSVQMAKRKGSGGGKCTLFCGGGGEVGEVSGSKWGGGKFYLLNKTQHC